MGFSQVLVLPWKKIISNFMRTSWTKILSEVFDFDEYSLGNINAALTLSSLPLCRAGVAEWFTVVYLLCAAWMVVGLSPNFQQCLWTRLQVCGSKRFGCQADLCAVSRCHTRGESEESVVYRQGSTQARDPPWLWNLGQTSPEVQTGVSVAPWKGLLSSKNLKKKKSSLSFNSVCFGT